MSYIIFFIIIIIISSSSSSSKHSVHWPTHRTWDIYICYMWHKTQTDHGISHMPNYYESNWENAWFLPVDQIISGLHHSIKTS